MKSIRAFRGEYGWLSNFYPSVLEVYDEVLGQLIYVPTVEHGYQADKTDVIEERREILWAPTPRDAKRLGRRCTCRADWEEMKVDVMYHWLQRKFSIPEFRGKIIATGDAELIEGNTWGDRFWGVCYGEGENMLGKLLMKVRSEVGR